MDIRIIKPMQTRPCKYCLTLKDDSVFADFEVTDNGCLFIVRISFDGFGCCVPEASVSEMDEENSRYLIACIESNSIDPEAVEVLRNYFRENKTVLWEDALLEHALI